MQSPRIPGHYLCAADAHPDHDALCKFRRENFEAESEPFFAGFAAGAGAEAFEGGHGERRRDEGGSQCQQAQERAV